MDEYDEIEIGQTIRQNHEDCPAGTDERQRQYITRPEADPAKLIWYCHNCGNGGLYHSPKYQAYREDRFSSYLPPDPVNGPVEEPPGLIATPHEWPTEAKAWLYKRGLTHADAIEFEIKHDPTTNSIYLPRYYYFIPGEGNVDYAGYQLRSLYSGPKKYITVLEPDANTYSEVGTANGSSLSIVVVEDLASAIRVNKATGYMALVLYGVRCEPTVMYNLAQHYDEVFVWLDNDNDYVCNTAKTIAKTINLYDPTVAVKIVPFEFSDAKYYKDTEIKEILNGLD